jgi:hypothetical protein
MMQGMKSRSHQGESPRAGREPHARIKVGARELLLSLAVISVGLFLATAMMSNPAGHALRRVGTAAAAVVLGLAGIGLSFGRACSGCGGWLRKLSIGGSRPALATLEQALGAGDGPATARALQPEGGGPGAGSLDIAFCEGCRRLVIWRERRPAGQGKPRQERTVTGPAAQDVTLVLSTYRAQQQEPAP